MADDAIKWTNNRIQISGYSPIMEGTYDAYNSWTFLNFDHSLSYSNGEKPLWHGFITEGPQYSRSWGLYFFLNGVDSTSKDHVSVYLVLESKLAIDFCKSRATLKFYRGDEVEKKVEGSLMKDIGDICGIKKWKVRPSSSFNVKVVVIITEELEKVGLDYSELLLSCPAEVSLIGDDWKLFAHKKVLLESSPVFRAMFSHDLEEAKTNTIKINDIDSGVMRSLLVFMYTGEAIGLSEIVDQLVKAADKYCMDELKKKCEYYMLKHLSKTNIAQYLVTAEQCKLESLKEKCLKMLCLLPENILKYVQNLESLKEDNKLLVEYINKLVIDNVL